MSNDMADDSDEEMKHNSSPPPPKSIDVKIKSTEKTELTYYQSTRQMLTSCLSLSSNSSIISDRYVSEERNIGLLKKFCRSQLKTNKMALKNHLLSTRNVSLEDCLSSENATEEKIFFVATLCRLFVPELVTLSLSK